MTEKIPVILDCDNTMGLPGCDVDDGLALLYLLGSPGVRLLGVTCSYGNSTQETVHRNTLRLLDQWGRRDIPVYRGSQGPGQLPSPAADFLAAAAREHSGALRLLVTGSTTNLLGAMSLDGGFLDRLHTISLMGGVTEPLLVGGKPMAELNLSIDAQASLEVLRRGRHIRIATAQNCLSSFFPRSDLTDLAESGSPVGAYLAGALADWYAYNAEHWNLDGIVNWDVTAAAQLVCPELFDLNDTRITPTPESMAWGMLLGGGPAIPVQLPVIRDPEQYRRRIWETCLAARIHNIWRKSR